MRSTWTMAAVSTWRRARQTSHNSCLMIRVGFFGAEPQNHASWNQPCKYWLCRNHKSYTQNSVPSYCEHGRAFAQLLWAVYMLQAGAGERAYAQNIGRSWNRLTNQSRIPASRNLQALLVDGLVMASTALLAGGGPRQISYTSRKQIIG